MAAGKGNRFCVFAYGNELMWHIHAREEHAKVKVGWPDVTPINR